MTSKEQFDKHINKSLNYRVTESKKDESYYSKESILHREEMSISKTKRWKELNNPIKTKKKHL